MHYKTILVHVDDSPHAAARIALAASIAVSENAHLIGAAMSGVSRFVEQNSSLDLAGPIVRLEFDKIRARCADALVHFEAIARQAGVLSLEQRLIDDDAQGGLALQTRYCDLVVISQTDPDHPDPGNIADLPQHLVLNCVRPILMVPAAGNFTQVGKRILIAWDSSLGATRAVTNALPLLSRAEKVTVVVINPDAQFDAHGDQPGADIGLYLARHGVNVELLVQQSQADVGNALLSVAADIESDLIVMGGYGHSRLLEMLLGGVTRTILRDMTVPILMSR